MLPETGKVLKKFRQRYGELFQSAVKDYKPQYFAYGKFDEINAVYELISTLSHSVYTSLFDDAYDEDYVLPSDPINELLELKGYVEKDIRILEGFVDRYKNQKSEVPDPISTTLKYHKKLNDVIDHVLDFDEVKEILDNKINKDNTIDMNSKKVFIVHGHNEGMKQSVARILERIGLEPIILHEQPSKGKTIIEKFSENADVSFALVLLSGDDLAFHKGASSDTAKPRARQNVIFELGYFIGRIGRERVVGLYEENGDIELPSDYQGIIFVTYDSGGAWKHQILKEMKAVGIDVDLNKI